jgi:N-acetylglucosaminyldiphosphoundecaprenol N-acetyl-beta-D-mannosaminyltransferase
MKKVYFYSIPFSVFSNDEFDNTIINSVDSGCQTIVYGFSLHSIYSLKFNPEILLLGKKADVILTDGRVLYWLLKIYRTKIFSSLSIPQSVFRVLNIANQFQYSLYLLGATEESNNNAVYNIRRRYSGINIVGNRSGYFDTQTELSDVISSINQAKPDILLIGMSSPIKERISFLYRNRLMAKIIIPCGGMIDVLSGKTKASPNFIKAIGLASVYRIVQEPHRLLFDRIKFYFFVFFNFLPVLFWHSKVRKNTTFSIIDYYYPRSTKR